MVTALNSASSFEGNVSSVAIIVLIVIGILFVVLGDFCLIACAVVLLLCDRGKIRSKKVAVIVVLVLLALDFIAFAANCFIDSTDYGSLSSGMIALHKLESLLHPLLCFVTTILMELSLCVKYEKGSSNKNFRES